MPYSLLADLVLAVHLAFIAFVVGGAVLVRRRRRLAWLHAPAVVWGVCIEFAGWTCPLTPWEVALRRRAGAAGYSGGFIEHYLTALIYPTGLTRETQMLLGTLALVLNVTLYWIAFTRARS